MKQAAVTEAELQAAVIDLARVYGYRGAHFRPALTRHGWRTPVAADGAGFPDLLLVKPGRIIAAELKSDAGRITSEQRAWLIAFEAAGVEAHQWRPADLQDIAKCVAMKRLEADRQADQPRMRLEQCETERSRSRTALPAAPSDPFA